MAARSYAVIALAGVGLAACATAPHPTGFDSQPGRGITTKPRADASRYKVGKPYQVKGVWYTPAEQPRYDETGIGSWYGDQFHNRYTANGEVFDMARLSAAHKTLPLPSLVEVTNLDNGRKAVVRINDRGPFVDGRIIDLSKAAAEQLGYQRQGVARVRVRYIGRAPLLPTDGRVYLAAQPVSAPPEQAAAPRPVRIAAAPRTRLPIPSTLSSGWLTTPQFLPPAGRQAMLTQASRREAPSTLPIARSAAPPMTPPSPPEPLMAEARGSYSIQVGAFSERANAERAVSQLVSTGRPEITEIQRNGASLYRVTVSGEGEAGAAQERVSALGFDQARVISAR